MSQTHASALPNSTPKASTHSFAYRLSSSIFGKRFYVALFIGPEQRSEERLELEEQRGSLLGFFFDVSTMAFLIVFALIFVTGASVVIAYLIKTAAGIDLFEGPSIFHAFFF